MPCRSDSLVAPKPLTPEDWERLLLAISCEARADVISRARSLDTARNAILQPDRQDAA